MAHNVGYARQIFLNLTSWRTEARRCLCQTGAVLARHKRRVPVQQKVTKYLRKKVPVISVFKEMTVKELASSMEKDTKHVISCLRGLNISQTVKKDSAILDINVISEVCHMSGVKHRIIARPSSHKAVAVDHDVYSRPKASPSICKPRPPVVTIMGHVDHGKTTLLDYLRKSKIVDMEFGGITQHIGAFSVTLKDGKSITFLDTPGHAAFSSMRGRGAKITDIIVLVVAADDGVMPQTIESIKHATQSQAPIIVAMNKCDREEAEVEACKRDLAEHGVVLEELGGDVIGVEISALHGTNIDALQEAIITQAEMMDIKADPTGAMEGRIIETKTEEGRGKIASILVQRGTLNLGSFLVSDLGFCKVRRLNDEHGKPMKTAGPGQATEVVGWKELPSPGAEVLQVENESQMKKVIRKAHEQQLREEEEWNAIKENRRSHEEEHTLKVKRRHELGLKQYVMSLRRELGELDITKPTEDMSVPRLSLIVKADVDGSLEAILSCLETYSSDLCEMEILSSGVGEVGQNDVELAEAFDGIVLAFNTKSSDKVEKLATDCNVLIRKHNIIYKLVDDVKSILNERVLPQIEQKVLGEAVIQKVFYVTEKINKKNKKIPVAGCLCINGVLDRSKQYKLVRGSEVLHVDTLYMLKHFKNEVEEIKDNMECGLAFKDHGVDILEGDSILCYEEYQVKPEITWNLPF
ncbi:translation initiation factor IF-2, mitochondrial-like isoform X2 [Watersipora subatra]|uniref:translation initiation factor IF-2, mitochondrial-like isoform X2 n=1 Tax=Watersipora subatra TaxID=2589382 RepID=UPI00355BE31C